MKISGLLACVLCEAMQILVVSMKKKTEKALIQAWVDLSLKKKLSRVAKAAGRSDADYLRQLLVTHLNAVTPKLIRALAHAWKGLKPGDGEVKK